MMRHLFKACLLLLSVSILEADPVGPADEYVLIWSDEFDGATLDEGSWNIEEGAGFNNELQSYTRKGNLALKGGALVITARKRGKRPDGFSSARINTKGKAEFQYGKIEARIRLPYGNGLWPAFWMMGADFDSVGFPNCGEIDIAELVGGAAPDGGLSDSVVYSSLHRPSGTDGGILSYTGKKAIKAKFSDDFHVFGMVWNETEVVFQLDGEEYFRKDISGSGQGYEVFKKPYFIILNLAIGGTWPGPPDGTTVWPQEMLVDWVRAYEKEPGLRASE